MLYIFNWASIAKQVMDILGRTNKVSLEVLGRVSLIWNDHLNAKTQVWFLPQPGTWQMRWWGFFLLTFNLCEYLTQVLVNPFTRSLALALLRRDWCFLAIPYTQRTSCSVKFPNFLSQISKSSKKPQELSVSNKEEYWENITVGIMMLKPSATGLIGHFLLRIQFGHSSYPGFSFLMWSISDWYKSCTQFSLMQKAINLVEQEWAK